MLMPGLMPGTREGLRKNAREGKGTGMAAVAAESTRGSRPEHAANPVVSQVRFPPAAVRARGGRLTGVTEEENEGEGEQCGGIPRERDIRRGPRNLKEEAEC